MEVCLLGLRNSALTASGGKYWLPSTTTVALRSAMILPPQDAFAILWVSSQDIAGPVNLSKALDAGKATRLLQFSRTWEEEKWTNRILQITEGMFLCIIFFSPRTCC